MLPAVEIFWTRGTEVCTNLEVITRRSGSQADAARRQADPLSEVCGALAGIWRRTSLAGELA